jgi:hypothetical protein
MGSRFLGSIATAIPPGTSRGVVSEDGCIVLIIWERPVLLE